MFTTILGCTDGSPHADEAVRAATDLAVHEHARLHLVHVDEKLVARHIAGQDASVIEPEILAKIQAQAAEITAREIRCELHIVSARVGHVAEHIAETAADTGAELIVIATRGRSALGDFLLGSVTQRLLQISACPVLAIPPGAAIGPDEGHATASGQTSGR
jgi:nucleotide-binding universal stress UspA family protein